MITSLTAFTKSAGLIAWPPNPKANANHTPFLPISTHPNFRESKQKKRQSRKLNASRIRCHDTPEKQMLQGSMYRRQLLLTSISFALKPQQMVAAASLPPNLIDYRKLPNAVQEAEKLKNTSHDCQEINDVVCWLSSAKSLKPRTSENSDKIPGIIAVPPASNEKVVIVRVRRPKSFKLRLRDKEEQLVLQGIEVTNDKPFCFDVYIKSGQDENDDEVELYAGTFSHMPPRQKQQRRRNNKPVFDSDHQEQKSSVRRCCLRLGIDGVSIHLHNLKPHQEESVIVKLVPTLKVDEDPIKVESIFIEYT